ncbi:MAG: hypothetical protein ABGY41_08690 [Candidatus Poribacteria bacterium]
MTSNARRSALLLLAVCAIAPVAHAEWREEVGRGAEGQEGRKYAPDRLIDVQLVRIEVTPDFDRRSITAVTSIEFRPIAEPVREIALDAVGLAVSSITSDREIEGYSVREKQISITFVKAIPPGEDATVTVAYTAEPKKGLYFRTADMGYREEDTQLWTQGETYEARHWFPSFDYPNERFQSEVICHVPGDMTVVSNGLKVGEFVDEATGLKTSHWHQQKPHVNYLIALVVGRFAKLESTYRDIPLGFYVPETQRDFAANSFRDTAEIMGFFEKDIGVPYPWVKYDQVAVLGRLLARIHDTGESLRLEHRRTLGPETVVDEALDVLDRGDFVPPRCRDRFAAAARGCVDVYRERSEDVPLPPIHGDCHVGNLLTGFPWVGSTSCPGATPDPGQEVHPTLLVEDHVVVAVQLGETMDGCGNSDSREARMAGGRERPTMVHGGRNCDPRRQLVVEQPPDLLS